MIDYLVDTKVNPSSSWMQDGVDHVNRTRRERDQLGEIMSPLEGKSTYSSEFWQRRSLLITYERLVDCCEQPHGLKTNILKAINTDTTQAKDLVCHFRKNSMEAGPLTKSSSWFHGSNRIHPGGQEREIEIEREGEGEGEQGEERDRDRIAIEKEEEEGAQHDA